MANTRQPPFTPEQARAVSRAGPKSTTSAGKAGSTNYGSKVSGKMFKPGKRTGATGPESGRNRKR